jgi:hypothetical protein
MCDYSLRHLASRPAVVDDKLKVSRFSNSMSIGFAGAEDVRMPVCVLPGTELAFDDNIATSGYCLGFGEKTFEHNTARFRQVNLEQPHTHHDALELPNGEVLLLHSLKVGQTATVLQLPAAPQTEQEAKAQERLEVVA